MEVPPAIPNRGRKSTRRDLVVCVVAVIFSLQVLAAGLVAPVFSEMFMDFGPQLPLLSRLVLSNHYLWMFAGVAGVVWSIILFIWARNGSPVVRRIASAIAAVTFLLGQTLMVAYFLPVFQLSAVVGEEAKIQDR